MPDFHEKITLRPMLVEDLEAVLEIESASFCRPWTRTHFLDEIRSAFSDPCVATLADGSIAGYLCLKQVLDEAEILDVAVRGALRGRGIGRLLVEHALSVSRSRGARFVSLEVRLSNEDAISLYRRAGFREVGRRKRYYENGEDAMLMEYTIT